MERKIVPVVTKRKLQDPKTDVEYWRSQPYEARLAAVEEIRQEYHRWKGDAQSRLQRVYRVTKRQ